MNEALRYRDVTAPSANGQWILRSGHVERALPGRAGASTRGDVKPQRGRLAATGVRGCWLTKAGVRCPVRAPERQLGLRAPVDQAGLRAGSRAASSQLSSRAAIPSRTSSSPESNSLP
jgi:hypothetical protein